MDQILSSLSEYPVARPQSVRRTRRLARPLRTFAAVAAASGALALLVASEPHGGAVRGDLKAAAARLRDMPPNAAGANVASALAREFPDQSATIDPTGFPASVSVTLHALDRASCAAALRTARRIEGRVVVQLETYRSSADCTDRNEMTWRLMP
ncbi:MAG TPA: hypothetical protein VLV50_04605 [Stellaceae bacterium]|nr:hypothetical protein [Stellaceae bacterium]